MVPFTGYNTRILNESSRKNIPDKIGMTARCSSVCHPPTGISHPQLWIGHFLYYIPYFLSTSLCNCNTNSYCDLCWYQWQPLGVVAFAALTPASPCRKDALHSPSSSRYYALLNQSCHCYCCLLAALPCPARFFDSFVRFMAARPDSLSLSLSLSISLRVVWNQPGASMNFINKTTSANAADKATTDRRYACISVWSRRAWKICTAPNPLRGKEARPAVGSRFSKAGQARRHRATYRPRGWTTFVPRFQEPSATLLVRSHKLIASNPEETGDFFSSLVMSDWEVLWRSG